MTVRFVSLTEELLRFAAISQQDTMLREWALRPEYAARTIVPGLSYAMLDGGCLISAGGVAPNWPGFADAWWLVTHLARPRHLVQAIRFCNRELKRVQADPAYRRIEINTRREAPWGQTFTAAMGFKHVGHRRGWYPDGGDADLWERLA